MADPTEFDESQSSSVTDSADRDPPATRRQTVTETRHGHEFDDPFRWLESDDETVREWTDRQNEYVDAHLETATRRRLRPRLADIAATESYSSVESAGDRYFRTISDAEDDRTRLFVSESLTERGRCVLDQTEWTGMDSTGTATSLAWFLPGPTGEFVAVGVTEGGDELVDIHVVTVPEGETVAVEENCGRVSRAFVGYDPLSPGMVAWDTDDWAGTDRSTERDRHRPPALVYVATGDATESEADAELRRWVPGDDGDGRGHESTTETLLTHDGRGWPLVETDPDSGTLAVAFHDSSGTEWHVRAGGEFRQAIERHGETFLTIHDGRVYVLTDHDAPRKRLLACPLAQFRAGGLSFADCETIRPESESVLQSFVVTDDHLVVHAFEDAHSRLDVFDHEGDHQRALPGPTCGTISRLRVCMDSERVVHREESFDRPPTVVATNPETGERVELDRVELDTPDDLVVERRTVESTDGAAVPLFLCYRGDLSGDGERPAVLHGYGGFRSSRPPTFDRFRLPFLTDGGVFAQVCARGGQEYGEPWHEAGMAHQKQHTFDDFLAAARHLCDTGVTTPDSLAVTGRSNGGLSVGAVLTQAPDRFAGVVCDVPLLDMLRYHEFGMGSAWTSEYGDPEDPEAFETLRSYSPYHNVDAGRTYPPTLLTTATDDTRVHPCHARKMAARLQTEADGGPFLLRTREDAGHGSGVSTESVVAAQTDRWTFLYDSLAVSPEGPADADADSGADADSDSGESRS